MATAWEVEDEQSLDTSPEATTPKLQVVVPPVAPGAPSRTQLAYENNNPGNLEYRGQPGAAQNGRWAQFQKPEDGYQALQDQIDLDAKRGISLGDYVKKYAPKNENDTEMYTRNAEGATGLSRNAPLSSVDRDKLAAFQVHQESGASVWDVASESPISNQASSWEVSSESPIQSQAPQSSQTVVPGMEQLGGAPPAIAPRPIPPGLQNQPIATTTPVINPQTPAAEQFAASGTKPPLYMAPGPADGLVKPGTIDLTQLPPVDLGDGTWGTVRSASREVNGKEILYPTIVNGKPMSDDDAFAYAMKTGRNLGVFTDGGAADAYAQRLHEDWEAGKIPGVQMRPGDPRAANQPPWPAASTPITQAANVPFSPQIQPTEIPVATTPKPAPQPPGPAFVTPYKVAPGSMPGRQMEEPGLTNWTDNLIRAANTGKLGATVGALFENPLFGSGEEGARNRKALDDDLSTFLVGPLFAIQKGIIEAGIETATNPGNLAIAGGVAGAGKVAEAVVSPYVKAAWHVADGALNAYFSGQSAGDAAVHGENAWESLKDGKYEDAAKELGFASTDALFAYLGARGAIAKGLDINTGIQQGIALGKIKAALQDEAYRREADRQAQERAASAPKQIEAPQSEAPVVPAGELPAPTAPGGLPNFAVSPEDFLKQASPESPAESTPPGQVTEGMKFTVPTGDGKVTGVAGDRVQFEIETQSGTRKGRLPLEAFQKMVTPASQPEAEEKPTVSAPAPTLPSTSAPASTAPATPGQEQNAQTPGKTPGTPEQNPEIGATKLPGIKSPVVGQQTEDIITGTLNPPLTEKGERDAKKLADHTSNVTEVNSGPMTRTQDTAEEIATKNHVPVAENPAFGPWNLGQFQGKPQGEVDDQINQYIANPDKPVPGGTSFNAFKNPLIGAVQKQVQGWKPGQRIMDVTHSIGVQTIQAWASNGAPEDKSISTQAMLEREKLEPAALFRIDPRTMEMTPAKDTSQDGIYLARHGDTPLDNVKPQESARVGAETGTKPPVSLPSPSLPSHPTPSVDAQKWEVESEGPETQNTTQPEAKPSPAGPIPHAHWMNRMDIEEAVDKFKNHPVLSRATQFLHDFQEEVDDHSDGWPYWPLPIHAAQQLMGMIQHPEYASEQNFKKSLAPIRAFYTKRGTAAGMKFPEIAAAPTAARAPGGQQEAKEPVAEEHKTPAPAPTKAEQPGKLLLTGNTYPQRVVINRLGGKWDKGAKNWIVPDTPEVRAAVAKMKGVAIQEPEKTVPKVEQALVMEKVKTDAEINRLSRLMAAHQNQQFAIARELASVPNQIRSLEQMADETDKDIALRDKNAPKDFAIDVQGKKFTGKDAREAAGEALNKAAADWSQSEEPVKIGTYRGFTLLTKKPFAVSATQPLLVRGARTYDASIGQTGTGTLASLEYVTRPGILEDRASNLRERVEEQKKKLADLKEEHGKPFKDAKKFVELQEKQKQLNAQLDLSKSDSQSATVEQTAAEQQAVPMEAEEADQHASERGAAPMITDLGQALRDRFKDKTPLVNYSGLGAAERVFLPGKQLAEIEKANKPIFRAAARAGSSEALSSTVMQSAMPAIRKALEGSPYTWDEMATYYVESRLKGLKGRWEDFARQADESTDEDLANLVKPEEDGSRSFFVDLLSKIEGRHGLSQNLGQTAAALSDAKDWTTMRKFLADTFTSASQRVASLMDPAWFDSMHEAVQGDPRVKEADRLYGELIEKPMADNHALNEGVFSDALGPAGRYFPLISVRREIKAPVGRRLPYRIPQNQANAFATGLSESYDFSVDSFAKRLTYGIRGNDKAALIRTLQDEGWAVPENQAHRTEEGILAMIGPDGKEYKAVREEIAGSRPLVQNKKVVMLKARFTVMPLFINRALRPILDRTPMDPDDTLAMVRWANLLSTKGPLELVFHSSGVLGSLYANTPFIGPSGLDKALSLPILKWFAIRGKLWQTDPTTPENVKKLMELAKAGALPAKSGKVTYSKDYAEMTGAKRERLSFAPLLYGPHGIDARARIMMYDIWKAAYPKGTVEDLHHFVNQIGNYTPELQGEIEKFMKRIGMGPFATAGMTRIVNALQNYSGTGPGPGGTRQARLQWWLTASALASLAVWVVAHKLLTGKYPLEEKASKLFNIPVQAGHGLIGKYRHSKIGDALWGKGNTVGYLNMSFFDDPLALRGARALGIGSTYEAHQLGAKPGQLTETAEKDILNTFSGPMMGPAARALFVGATGEEPYITGFRDYRSGRPGLQLLPAIPAKTRPGLPTVGQRGLAAAKELNRFYTEGAENLGSMTGFTESDRRANQGTYWIRTLMDLAAPGLVGNSSNPYQRANALRQQQRALGVK